MAFQPWMISVDPGLSGTGAVAWSQNGVPVKSRVFTVPQHVTRQAKPGEDDIVARARYLAAQVTGMAHEPPDRYVFDLLPYTVVIEFPEFQAGAARMMGWKTGSLQKLTFLVGVMAGALPEHWRVILVEPSKWKGQLPKEVVQRRMTARYGVSRVKQLNVQTHAWDALGIGEWAWRQEFMQ